MLNRRLRPSGWLTALYLIPSFLVYLFVFIIPVFLSCYFSLFKFTSIRKMTFIGLDNFSRMITDANALLSLKNNLFLVAICLVGQVGFAFVLASMLNSKLIKRPGFYRTVIYFPVTLSAVVIGFVWLMIYDYNYGLLTSLFRAFGMNDFVKPWLSQADSIMYFICIPMIWQYVGFHLVIILSGMTSIDPEIFEMSEIDGVNGWQKAVYITLPMIKGTLSVCVLLCVSANMKVFDHIITMTNGGPGYSSSVLAVYAYKTSFNLFNLGYGNTLSVGILLVTVTLFTLTNVLLKGVHPGKKQTTGLEG